MRLAGPVQFNNAILRLTRSKGLNWLELTDVQQREIVAEFEATLPAPPPAQPLWRNPDGSSVAIGGGAGKLLEKR